MANEIDAELLICLVESRPVLWDKNVEYYKDREHTFQGWNSVCACLTPEFEEWDNSERHTFHKEVIRKWSNIRDSYMKSCRKLKDTSSKRIRQYIYSEQLHFLGRSTRKRSSVDSLPIKVEETEIYDPETATTSSSDVHSEQSYKRKKQDDLERILINYDPLEAAGSNQDSNMSFFAGILPHLKHFGEDDIMEFQMGVLQLIKKIKHNKKRT